jgi:protein-tyrosine phosphatase
VDAVLDLTAELHAPSSIVRQKAYRCLPILDTRVPSKSELIAEVRRLQAHDGTTFVHCAQGHGRTGLVACALLIAEGQATTADEALARARQRRPRVRLSDVQRRLLVEVIPDLTSDRRAGSPAV